jgi:hypothetical protein
LLPPVQLLLLLRTLLLLALFLQRSLFLSTLFFTLLKLSLLLLALLHILLLTLHTLLPDLFLLLRSLLVTLLLLLLLLLALLLFALLLLISLWPLLLLTLLIIAFWSLLGLTGNDHRRAQSRASHKTHHYFVQNVRFHFAILHAHIQCNYGAFSNCKRVLNFHLRTCNLQARSLVDVTALEHLTGTDSFTFCLNYSRAMALAVRLALGSERQISSGII